MTAQPLIDVAHAVIERLRSKVIGQEDVVKFVVMTVLCRGHTLLTGAPGVAKTMLVRNLAGTLGCGYKRIQFTPDLTPFDILGGEVISFDAVNPDIKRIVFAAGPIFAPFVLADEINRASPRTQSALLEAMQERQVSINGQTHLLPRPFYVFATQNPIESDGTFPLPDAQLDRFLFNIEVPYPPFEAERIIATLDLRNTDAEEVPGAQSLFQAWEVVQAFPMDDALVDACVRLVKNTRPQETTLGFVRDFINYGASPRATQALVLGARASALISGRSQVTIDDIVLVAPAVLRHRIQLSYRAAAERLDTNALVKRVLAETVV
jgi:MoxR-like ATPase